MPDKEWKPKARRSFALVTYGILLYMGLQHFSQIRAVFAWIFAILKPVIVGICIAFVINLVMKLFRRKVFAGMERSKRPFVQKLCPVCCAASTALVAAGFLALMIFLIIPQITTAVNTLIEKLPSSEEQLLLFAETKLTEWHAPQFIMDELHAFNMDWDSVFKFLGNVLDGKVETVLGTAWGATTSVVSELTNFLLGLIIAIYILAQKQRVLFIFHKLIELFVPQKYQKETFRILKMTNTSFANFLTGQIVESIIMGSLTTIVLVVLRFPFAATIGVLTGITVLLPIIGAWIGGGIGALLIWVNAPDKVLWFLLVFLILQQLEGQFIYPKVVGDSIGLPGLLVLVAVILGGGLGGIFGIIFAVPTFAILYSLLKEAIDRLPAKASAAEAVPDAPAPVPDGESAENDPSSENP